jgi:hypothetical protein
VKSVIDAPIGETVIYKAWFPRFRPEVYYCQLRKDPFFMEISDASWYDKGNVYGHNSAFYCCDS